MVTAALAGPRLMSGSMVIAAAGADGSGWGEHPGRTSPARSRAGRSGRVTRLRRPAFLERGDDVGAAPGVALESDDALLGRFLEELRERRVAVVGLVEGGVLPDHRLLDHRSPE